MRDILFRAQRTDTKEWVYGYYACAVDIHGLKQHNILVSDNSLGYFEWVDVIPETVGQYTGLKDKNENKIFEGDIVKNSKGMIGKIIYVQSFCGFCIADDNGLSSLDDTCIDIEVIGNIFDNPELLKEGD